MLLRRDGADIATQLLPENMEVASIYMLTRNQVVTMGQGHPVDISIPAVKIAMDLHGVEDQRTCLQRVRNLWHMVESERCED